jgi:hypothetical protein
MNTAEHWVLIPFKSVGPIDFGAHRKEVRVAVPHQWKPIEKGGQEADAYDALAVHVFYGKNNSVDWIEAFRYAESGVTIQYCDVELTQGNVSQAVYPRHRFDKWKETLIAIEERRKKRRERRN